MILRYCVPHLVSTAVFTGSVFFTSPTPFDHVPPLFPLCVDLGIFFGVALYRFCSDITWNIRQFTRRFLRSDEHDEEDEDVRGASHLPFYYDVRQMDQIPCRNPGDVKRRGFRG